MLLYLKKPFAGTCSLTSLRNFMLLLVLACCVTAGATPPPILIDPRFTERAIGLDLAIFEDKTGQRTLQEVQTSEYAAQFTPSTKKSPSFGYTQSAYWARFELKTNTPLVLTLAYAQTDLAELWCANADGAMVVQQRAGDHVPLAEWPSTFRNPAFDIPAAARTCWLRVQSSASLQIPLTLSTPAAFADLRVQDATIQALYFGALLVMLVYNGLLAATTRSWVYANYTLFLLGYGLFQCALGGIGYQLLWPNAIGFADRLNPFFIACLGVSSSFFAIILLDLRQAAPRFYKLGLVVIALSVLNLALAWLLPYPHAIKSVFAVAPLWFLFLMGSGITLAWRGMRVAQIYVAAWLVFVFGTIILVMAALGLLPINAFTTNAHQIGSAVEFVMLSLALAYRIKMLQDHVALSTRQALIAQAQAELARKEAEYTRDQLQQADKMASLGQLIAGVTHEINTPIGAIKSSGGTITEALHDALAQLPPLLRALDAPAASLLMQLIEYANTSKTPVSSREERAIVKKATEQLDAAGIAQARHKAVVLVNLNAQNDIATFLPLLQHAECERILQAVGNVATAIGGVKNVNVAVERVAKIVLALKSFSHFNQSQEMIQANLAEGIETVLTIYQGQTKVGIEIVRNYEDIAPLACLSDELSQVWTNLIHNALQAMNHEGTLTIGIRREDNAAVVSVGDSGCGIPEEIRSKIFDVFFTTKPAGVGSGLGLDIVKKIIAKHHGRIDVQSAVGVGTTFSVYLPYSAG